MRVKELLNERYINAFTVNDKAQYAEKVWAMLQRSYEPIGGIHGKGFTSIDDMIQSNFMFKLGKNNGNIVMVSIYRQSGGGRKKVALGTDGSKEGIMLARDSLKAELLTGRAFGEVSGPVFGSLKKLIPPEVLTTLLIPATEVGAMLNKEVIIGAGEDMRTVINDPYEEFYYQRMIGPEMHTKVAYGDPKGKAKLQ